MKSRHLLRILVVALIAQLVGFSPTWAWNFERNNVSDGNGGSYNFQYTQSSFNYNGQELGYSNMMDFKTVKNLNLDNFVCNWEFKFRIIFDKIAQKGDNELKNTYVHGEIFFVTEDGEILKFFVYNKLTSSPVALGWDYTDSEAKSVVHLGENRNSEIDKNGYMTVKLQPSEQFFKKRVKKIQFRQRLTYKNKQVWEEYQYEKDLDISTWDTFMPKLQFKGWQADGSIILGADNLKELDSNSTCTQQEYNFNLDYESVIGSEDGSILVFLNGPGSAITRSKVVNGKYNFTYLYQCMNKSNCHIYPYTMPVIVSPTIELDFKDLQSLKYYHKSEPFVVTPYTRPETVTTEFDKWKQKVVVKWTKREKASIRNYTVNTNTDGQWYVIRYEKNGDTDDYKLIGSLKGNNTNLQMTDDDIKYEQDYIYRVIFLPDILVDEYKDKLTKMPRRNGPHTKFDLYEEQSVNTKLDVDIRLAQDRTDLTGVRLRWEYNIQATGCEWRIDSRTAGGTTWRKVTTIPVDAEQSHASYTAGGTVCDFVDYRVMTIINGVEVYSNIISANLPAGSYISEVRATTGTEENFVDVEWKVARADQTNDIYYKVLRRLIGSDEWTLLTQDIHGKASEYSYRDERMMAGSYYEYTVEAYGAKCEDQLVRSDAQVTPGFSQARGTLTGHISYGTGTAVAGVQVKLVKSSAEESSDDPQFLSRFINGEGKGLTWTANADKDKYTIRDSCSFTIQLWAKPQSKETDGFMSLFTLTNAIEMGMNTDNGTDFYLSVIDLTSNRITNFKTLPFGSDDFTHIAAVHIKNMWKFYVGTDTLRVDSMYMLSNDWNAIEKDKATLTIGGSHRTMGMAYQGYVDDVRLWNYALSQKEIKSNYTRILGGTEKGLILYWPLDEGLSVTDYAFDVACKDGIYQLNHPEVGVNARPSEQVPSLLKLYGETDSEGDYIIRGIPFQQGGTHYKLVPLLGIHEFSPNTRSLFVSPTSLTANNVDFEDVSSFPMEGYIYYAGTNIPAEGIELYIDGELTKGDGVIKKTDANGYYKISVPIGKHFVEAKLTNHKMVDKGRFPTIGTYNFDSALKHDFADSTLVNLVGRVGGGENNDTLAVGFGASKNNIGIATITLKLNNESLSFNCQDDYISPATANRFWESDTTSIASHSWTGFGSNSKYIYIRTDSLTGEFSALLPPLKYVAKSIKVDKNPDIEFSSLPEIDLSDVGRVVQDSLLVDVTDEGRKIWKRYGYNTKYVQTYFAKPRLEVTQTAINGNTETPKGAYGLQCIKNFIDEFGTIEINDIWKQKENGDITYRFSYPIYRFLDDVSMEVYGYEAYTNYDTGKPVTTEEPLSEQLLTINNEMSNDQMVVANVEEEGTGYEVGDVYAIKSNELTLDKDGRGKLSWVAGLPNIVSPYTRQFSINYKRNDRTYVWNELNAIVLGNLDTGSNFVTLGPDHLLMVLRNPPGANSTTVWRKGTCQTKTTYWYDVAYGDEKFTINTGWGSKITTILGIAVAQSIEAKATVDEVLGVHTKWETGHEDTKIWSTTVTEAVSTNARNLFVNDGTTYMSAKGDVFVGVSTNLIIGDTRKLGFFRTSATDSLVIDVRNSKSIGDSIRTTFMYSAYEMERVMIPKWKATRNDQLTYVESKEAAEHYENKTDHCVYLTWLKKGSEELMVDSLTQYVMKAPKDSVFHSDSICWCNSQIYSWKQILAMNEADKVSALNDSKCFRKNISFDGETTYNYTERSDTTFRKKHITNWKAGGIFGLKEETSLSGAAYFSVKLDLDTEHGRIKNHYDGNMDENQEQYAQFEYNFKDGNLGSDFSVNIYKSPSGWSDIFSVVGGQSYNPHEDEEWALYYEPEKKHKLQNGTQRMEQPDIKISTDGEHSAKTASLTDIPAGRTAQFTLHLTNNSVTNQGFSFTYNLVVVEFTNANGLQIQMDGGAIGNGRAVFVPLGETIQKVITVKQTDTSCLDYDNIKIRFVSQYQPQTIFDEVTLNVHFKPSSSPIDLVIAEPVVNTDTPKGELNIKLTNFDRQFKNLLNVGLEYRYEGNTQWTPLRTYVTHDEDTVDVNNIKLPDTGDLLFSVDMSSNTSYPDGTYTFRGFTTTPYDRDKIRVYSDEITVVKDMVKPTYLTTPSPANGILGYGDELSVEFNEDIVPGYVGDKNVIVTAKLNQQNLTHEVSKRIATLAGDQRTANPLFLNGDFSFDFWLYLQKGSVGTILQLGKGQNTFSLSVDDEQRIVVTIAGNKFVSEKTIPNDAWTYIVLSYNSVDDTFSCLAQSDSYVAELFQKQQLTFTEKQAINYSDDNYLYLGDLKAYIHDLSLFNIYRNVFVAAASRSQTKDGYVYGLTNYWPMNEGHGTVAADMRHTHDFIVANDWWINNYNQSLVFLNSNGVEADISTINTEAGDSYAIELWAKVGDSDTEQTLFETGTIDSDRLRLYYDTNYDLKLQYGEKNQTVATNTEFPYHDEWVHYALNVVRGQSASFYRNGQRTAVIAETHLPPIQGSAIKLGQGMQLLSQIDELRIWNAKLSENRMQANMFNMIDTADVYSHGLVAYYPFEKPDPSSWRGFTLPTLENMASGATGRDSINGSKNAEILEIGAPLQSAPRETRLTAKPVASERKVVINLQNTTVSARELEGTTLKVTLADIHDTHDNTSQPILWTAYVQQNTLKWTKDSVNIIKMYGDDYTFDVNIQNKGGVIEYYTLYNMPQWLTLVNSERNDNVNPLMAKTLRFQVDPLVPVGNYDFTIGLQGNNEILEPLRVVMKVRGQKPDWAVDPTKYDHQMSIIGQVYLDGILMENSESMVAAFIDGECRGIASPMKVRGAAYVTMSIFGEDSKAKDQNKPVSFRVWDASKGVVYTDVRLVVDGESTNVIFEQDKMIGNFDTPAIWTKSDKVEQTIPIHENWNWIAMGVVPETTYLDQLFSDYKNWKLLIKNRNTFSDFNGEEWNGGLVPIVNEMYKLKVERLPATINSTLDTQLSISGQRLPQDEMPVVLRKNWNWIAYTPLTTMSIDEALAGANPQKGDIMKSQTAVSIYGSTGWEGSLQSLEGGHGYMYFSNDNTQKQFVYPAVSSASSRMDAPRHVSDPLSIFMPVDKYLYPNNMTMVIKLMDGAAVVDTVELAAFVGDECRGATRATNGLYYLIISGEGAGQPMTLRICVNNEILIIDDTQQFTSDDNVGTSWEPYVIDLQNLPVGITPLSTSTDDDDTDWWTLQGIKLGRKPSRPGIYIHRNKTVVVTKSAVR